MTALIVVKGRSASGNENYEYTKAEFLFIGMDDAVENKFRNSDFNQYTSQYKWNTLKISTRL